MDLESMASILTRPLRWVWDFVMGNRVLRSAFVFSLLAVGAYALLYAFMKTAGFDQSIKFVSANFLVWLMFSVYVLLVLPWASPRFRRWMKRPAAKRLAAFLLFLMLVADAIYWYCTALGVL